MPRLNGPSRTMLSDSRPTRLTLLRIDLSSESVRIIGGSPRPPGRVTGGETERQMRGRAGLRSAHGVGPARLGGFVGVAPPGHRRRNAVGGLAHAFIDLVVQFRHAAAEGRA